MTIYQERRFYFKGKKHIEYWADIDYGVYLQVHESQKRVLYTAPAADLADLVPDAIQLEPGHSPYVDEFSAAGWNACRAAILRNIEEGK